MSTGQGPRGTFTNTARMVNIVWGAAPLIERVDAELGGWIPRGVKWHWYCRPVGRQTDDVRQSVSQQACHYLLQDLLHREE
eukprot:COSAG01_NODE_6774_length_3504_cov_27.969457_3_plen_81_part_00